MLRSIFGSFGLGLLAVLSFGLFPAMSAEEPALDIPEVLFATDSEPPAQARLSDMDWFVGLWEGEVFGGIVEHRVMAPHKGHMPGIVRVRTAETDEVSMYELSSFIETGETITYRIRHFGADLIAFQPADEFIDRPLVAIKDDTLYFNGITFAKLDNDRAVVTFILEPDSETPTQHVVQYRRLG